jgi:uncharacterized protein YkwD
MPSYDTGAIERSVHELVNEKRTANGREPLEWSDDLSRLARAHSQDMVDRDFYSHTNPDGQSPSDRGQEMGTSCTAVLDSQARFGVGENIAKVAVWNGARANRPGGEYKYDWKTADKIAEDLVQGWMDSPGHRRNILEEGYGAEGLGVALEITTSPGGDERFYMVATQNFC